MKNCYFWATPSGPINLMKAEDMPVKPEEWVDDEGYLAGGVSPLYARKMRAYRKDLQAAKESSVPIQDQDRAKRMIMQWLNDQPLGQGMIERDRVHGPFTVGYRIEDACAHESCPVEGMCEHCKEPVKVAILLPEKEPSIDKTSLLYRMAETAHSLFQKDRVNLSFKFEPVKNEDYEELMVEFLNDYNTLKQIVPEKDLQEDQEALWREVYWTYAISDYVIQELKEKFTITRKQ